MKIKNILGRISLILVVFCIIGPIAVEGNVSVGLTYNFTNTNSQTYVNQFNDQFKSEYTQFEKIKVVGLNQTSLNYTTTLTQNSYSYATLQYGQWTQQDSNTKLESYNFNSINLTDQINQFDFTFDFYDNPTWNPAWNPSINYQSRFYFFDQKNETNPDYVVISYYLPNIVSPTNVQSFVSLIKQRITDRLTGSVNSFKIKYFNASSFIDDPNHINLYSEWDNWIQLNLKSNVVYEPKLINSDQGVIQLTPRYIGRYNQLPAMNYYNQTTGQYQTSRPLLSTSNVPLYFDSYNNIFSLQNPQYGPSLISINSLNEKQPNYSKYVQVTTSGLSLSFHVSTLYEEPPSNSNYYYYYYQPGYFSNDAQVTGTFTSNINIQYDSNGFLIKEISNKVYDVGSYGTYTISNQLTQTSNENNNNFVNTDLVIELAVIPVSIGSGVGLAYVLKKRKEK